MELNFLLDLIITWFYNNSNFKVSLTISFFFSRVGNVRRVIMNNFIPSRKQQLLRNNSNSPISSPHVILSDREEFLFEKEISDLMKSNGDSLNFQEISSVHLIEKVLKKEMHHIFYAASKAADERRDSSVPIQEDFEYAMRRNPIRVSRMRKALKNMQIMEGLQKMHKNSTPLNLDFRIQMWVPPETYDEEKTRRLFRADRISLLLSPNNFQKFNFARKMNLLSRSRSQLISMKFRKFLNLSDDYDFNENICQIVCHLANETILTIVDYAILTRLNSVNRDVDPHSRTANSAPNMTEMNMCPEVTQGRGVEASKPISESEILEGYRRFRFMTDRGFMS